MIEVPSFVPRRSLSGFRPERLIHMNPVRIMIQSAGPENQLTAEDALIF
jgi:hypothetical protein